MVDIKKINEPGSARGRTRLYQSLALDEGINQGRLSYIGPSGECDLGQDRRRILGLINGTFHEYSGLYDHVSVGNKFKVQSSMHASEH
jgi:hypothetical protein